MAASDTAGLHVELVAADRIVWSGAAAMVIARTVEGDVGVLKDHAPLLSVLAPAVVEIRGEEETTVAAVDGGFLSVANNRVSVLSEHVALASEIDVAAAQAAIEDAKAAEGPEAAAHVARFEAQIRAAERVS